MTFRYYSRAAAVLLSLSACSLAQAFIKPASLFTDNAVLQQQMPVPVWGAATPNEPITVSINGESASTVTDASGEWTVKLPPIAAGGPYTMTIKGTGFDKHTLNNILVGEVWICGGQSNMAYCVAGWTPDAPSKAAIPTSADPMLHFILISRAIDLTPQTSVGGNWQVSGPDTVGPLSAVGYFFGRELRKSLGVPVGLIHDNYSGSVAQAWTSREALAAVPDLRHYLDEESAYTQAFPGLMDEYNQKLTVYNAAQASPAPAGVNNPQPAPKAPVKPYEPGKWFNGATHLYNGMISPLIPYGIRGAIWYQGESNGGQGYEYKTLLPTMIADWRSRWGEGDFPFLIVQLAPFMSIRTTPNFPKSGGWMELREAQRIVSQSVPNTGMAVISDLGDSTNVHALRKEPVGHRLALIAEARVYGQKIEYSGPVFYGISVEGSKIRVKFTHADGLKAIDVHDAVDDGPLIASSSKLAGFEIAGANGRYVFADAAIDGETVVVSSDKVAAPVFVRYGWANYPVTNLSNAAGLPASPFKSDSLPWASSPQSAVDAIAK